MEFKDLTIMTTQQLADRLALESGIGKSAMNYNSLKKLSQTDHPFVIRIQITPGSKKPKVLFVYEWFKLWLFQGNEAVKDYIQRKTAPQINKYLESLIKKPPGRPTVLDQKKDELLRVVGGE